MVALDGSPAWALIVVLFVVVGIYICSELNCYVETLRVRLDEAREARRISAEQPNSLVTSEDPIDSALELHSISTVGASAEHDSEEFKEANP